MTTLSLQLLCVGLREFQKEVLHSGVLLLLLPSPAFIGAAYSQPLSVWTENIFSPFSVVSYFCSASYRNHCGGLNGNGPIDRLVAWPMVSGTVKRLDGGSVSLRGRALGSHAQMISSVAHGLFSCL